MIFIHLYNSFKSWFRHPNPKCVYTGKVYSEEKTFISFKDQTTGKTIYISDAGVELLSLTLSNIRKEQIEIYKKANPNPSNPEHDENWQLLVKADRVMKRLDDAA